MRPRRITLFIWLCIALLGLLCVVFPSKPVHIGSLSLRWATLASVLDLEKPAPAVPVYSDTTELYVEADTASVGESSPEVVPVCQTPVDTLRDTRKYLAAFYLSLREADRHMVRVVHYGDSQIEEDRMTQTVRRALQSEYGGGGVGLVPLLQTIPTRTLHQTLLMDGRAVSIQQGIPRNLVYGPKSMRRSDGRYGAMGQVALMNDSLQQGTENLTVVLEPAGRERNTESYFNRLRVWADGAVAVVNAVGDTLSAAEALVLPDSTTKCRLTLLGCGQVYGLSLEMERGIIVDNIPMRGCIGTVFRSIDREQLAAFYRETNTRLIILQFGGNAIPFNEQPSTIRGIVGQLGQQVQYLKACAPEASILFVGPGDMSTLIDGQQTTYPLLPYMDKLLAEMAEKEQIAYYSLYRAMGGQNSMQKWQQRGWAGADGVHFTRKGAEKAGKALADWLLDIPAPLATEPQADSVEVALIDTTAAVSTLISTETE